MDRVGVEVPLIQAPMAGSQDHVLAVAAASAGALGSVPSAQLSPDALRHEIVAFRAISDASLNVNFFTHEDQPLTPDTDRRWRELLARYYHEFGIDIDDVVTAAARQPFGEAMADVVEDLRPEVVSFHFGLPVARLLDRVRAAGAAVLSSATTLDEALWLQARGVDAVIAQGLEAGGHRAVFLDRGVATQVGTFALIQQLAPVMDVPIVAAGGIADAAGVAAARRLGASAVQVGTAFLTCPDSTTSAVHRAALESTGAHRTALTNLFTGRPARAIVNRLMHELGPMSTDAPPFPYAGAAIAPLRARAEAAGSGDFSPLWAGQHIRQHGLDAANLVADLANGFC